MKLFELYEARKTRFKPGTIWRDVRGLCVVKAFKIIDKDDLSKYEETLLRLDEGSDYGYSSKKECLEVIESSNKYGDLAKGRVLSWYQKYIENYYTPSLDK